MSESTLSLKRTDFESQVGFFLGYGLGSDAQTGMGDVAWTSKQQRKIQEVVKSGLRQFYFPPALEGSEMPYEWSFLKPVVSLALASGASAVDLPDDFAGIEGQISVSSSGGGVFWPVQVVSEGAIRQRFAEVPSATGQPVAVAVRPLKGTTNTRGQQCDLYVYPAADAAYTLSFAYYLLPNCQDGSHPYAYGGAEHVETILESCLAIAEQRLDDASSVHTLKFEERLRASIGMDRKKKAQHPGPNLDRSSWGAGHRRYRSSYPTTTFAGVTPS